MPEAFKPSTGGELGDREMEALRALFARGPTAMALLGTNGRFTSMNDAYCELMGYPREELLQLDTLALTHPMDRAIVSEQMAELLSGRRDSVLFEKRAVRKDGTIRWVQNSVALTRDAEGRPLNLIKISIDITARQLAEEDRRDAEARLLQDRERFNLVSEAAQVGFWFCDLPFENLMWDNRVKEHFWLPAETAVTIDLFYERLHPQDRERTRLSIAESIDRKRGYDIEYRTVSPSGAIKWIRAMGRGFYDAEGKPIRFDGVTLDVTGRKHNEEALRESRERLQASLDAAGAGTFRWNLQTNALEWDENLDALFGLPRGRTIRSLENFVAVVHPEERAGVVERCERCAREGADFSMEFRVVWPDGSIHWLDDKGRTYFDSEGRPLYMMGACVDITERKAWETALHESSERFRTLADHMSQLAWMANPDGHLFWYNRRWLEYTGRTLEEMFVQGWEQFHHPAHLARVQASWTRSLREGIEWEDTFPLRGEHGQERWFLSRAVPIRDDKGEVARWFGTNTDITEQRAAAQALAEAKEQAERASQAKDHFLAALSHELRTPLAPVLMTASALRNDEDLPPEIRADLAMIERNIALEARLIDDLLDLTRIGKGKLSLHRQWCDAHHLISLAAEIVRDEAAAKGLLLELDLGATETGLSLDPARFQQVIWNLLRNAVKFTPSGGRIRITTRNVGGATARVLHIKVIDTGLGIEAASLERIFAPFEQAETAHGHRMGGLGLGLAIARAIAEMHGGTLRAESPGLRRGSTFILDLPGASPIAPTATAPTSGSSTSGALSTSGASKTDIPLRLLLVEDNETTLRVLSTLLTRFGHHITTAANCAEARAAARQQTFDAVISDLGLPDGTGIDLMHELHTRHGWRGIALSGYGMEEDIARTAAAGFFSHLIKPVDVDQLRHAITDLAGHLGKR